MNNKQIPRVLQYYPNKYQRSCDVFYISLQWEGLAHFQNGGKQSDNPHVGLDAIEWNSGFLFGMRQAERQKQDEHQRT